MVRRSLGCEERIPNSPVEAKECKFEKTNKLFTLTAVVHVLIEKQDVAALHVCSFQQIRTLRNTAVDVMLD